MAFLSLSLLLLQTVTAAPALCTRQQVTTCPTADKTTIVKAGKSWTIGCGQDAYGGDLIPGKQYNTFDKCIQACGVQQNCVGVAYEGKNCYMKSKIGTKVNKASVWGAFLVPGSGPGSKTPGHGTDAAVPAAPVASAAPVAAPSVVAAPVPAASVAASVAAAPSNPVAIQKANSPVVSVAPAAQPSIAPAAQQSIVPVSTGGSGSCARPAGKTLSTKRGAPYNSIGMLTPLQGKISWAYNWGNAPDGTVPSGVQYIPMLWGGDSSRGKAFAAAAASAVAAGADTLLGFNEPDLAAQANMLDPTTAVAPWKQYMEPLKCTARLAAPAVTNGGSPMGLTWLKGFLSACSGCTIDVVPIHWYDSATNIAYFKQYISDAYAAGGNRPLWITEFGASGSDAEVATFLGTVLPWLDSNPMVERYAYFMAGAGNGLLLSSATQLSTIGQAYCH